MKNPVTIILFFILASLAIRTNGQTSEFKETTQQRLRLKANYGYGYIFPRLISGLSDLEKKRVNSYRSGRQTDFSAHYLFKKEFGLGLTNIHYLSDHVTPFYSMDLDGDGRSEDGSYRDNATINFWGVSLLQEIMNRNNKFFIQANAAAGLLSFNSEVTYTNSSYPSVQTNKLDGNTYGSYISFDFEYAVSKNIRLNVAPSALLGVFSKMSYNGKKSKLEEKENVSRVNISAGISIYM